MRRPVRQCWKAVASGLLTALLLVTMLYPRQTEATVINEGPNGAMIAALTASGALAITGGVLDGMIVYDLAVDEPSSTGLRWGAGIVGGLNLVGGSVLLVVSQELPDDERPLYMAVGIVQLAVGAGGVLLGILANGEATSPTESNAVLSPWFGPARDDGWQAGVSWTVSSW